MYLAVQLFRCSRWAFKKAFETSTAGAPVSEVIGQRTHLSKHFTGELMTWKWFCYFSLRFLAVDEPAHGHLMECLKGWIAIWAQALIRCWPYVIASALHKPSWKYCQAAVEDGRLWTGSIKIALIGEREDFYAQCSYDEAMNALLLPLCPWYVFLQQGCQWTILFPSRKKNKCCR